jgi:hypothetical protein
VSVAPALGASAAAVKVVGVYLVRNEVDVIETNRRHHHFATGLDEAIVLDNGSTRRARLATPCSRGSTGCGRSTRTIAGSGTARRDPA